MENAKLADGLNCEKEDIFSADVVLHFHEYIRRFLKEEEFLKKIPERLVRENPEVILVTNELGYGVVPIDAFDRAYRETAGRICCELAKRASQVHRVVCGIGTVIKDG